MNLNGIENWQDAYSLMMLMTMVPYLSAFDPFQCNRVSEFQFTVSTVTVYCVTSYNMLVVFLYIPAASDVFSLFHFQHVDKQTSSVIMLAICLIFGPMFFLHIRRSVEKDGTQSDLLMLLFTQQVIDFPLCILYGDYL